MSLPANNPRENRLFFLCRQYFLLLVISIITLSGCGEKPASITGHTTESGVLARVNNEAITQEDVDFSLERTFSQLDLLNVDAGLREKVLDSLIASRAMKQLALKSMDAESLERIKQLAKAYEEELYVKEYLQRNISAEPVTAEMVQQYYEQHPEEFGGEVLRDFELLRAPADMRELQRDPLLQKISVIRENKNWAGSAAQWSQEFGLEYQHGRSRKGLFNETLEQAISSLSQEETSDVIYIDGVLHIIRVTKVVQLPPKSLTEVSGDIRKRLAPLMLREAVKKAAAEARSKVDILLTADE